MKNDKADESSSVENFYREMITYPFLLEVERLRMTNVELIEFYNYVCSVARERGNRPSALETLEEMDIIQSYMNGEVTLEKARELDSENEKQVIQDIVDKLDKKRNVNLGQKILRYFKG